MKLYTFAARLFIGILFIFAAYHKILDPIEFSLSIRNYMIVPPTWSNFIALTLPWIELGAGIFLILGIQVKPASLLTSGMLGLFLIALIYAFAIGLDIDCGCFSSSASSSGRVGVYHLIRDTILFGVSASIILTDQGFLEISNLFSGESVSEA
jgi:uncharacterized membrane protein YphA (DoxX/SURF4 family)